MGLGELNALVLKELTARPGMPVYVDDIVAATGIEAAVIKRTVSNIKSTARNRFNKEQGYHPGLDIIDVVRGNAWMYRPNHVEASSVEESRKTVVRTPKVQVVQETIEPAPTVARPKGKTFTYHGKTASGETVISDEKDILYKVVPL